MQFMAFEELVPVKIKELKSKHSFKNTQKKISKIYTLIHSIEAIYKKYPSSIFHLVLLKEAYEGLQKSNQKKSFKTALLDPEFLKLQNYKKALEKFANTKNISKSHILKAHQLIQHNIKKDAGKIREGQNWIGPEGCSIKEAYFLPPEASKIQHNLEKLFTYFKRSNDEPMIKLALFFAQFLIIHPFMDGNGRTMRALLSPLARELKVINRCPLYVSGYLKQHRLRYFETLYQITENNNFNPWVQFFLNALCSSLKTELLFLKQLSKMYAKIQKEKKDIFHFKPNVDKLFYLIFVESCLLHPEALKALRCKKLITGKKMASVCEMPKLIRKIT